MLLHKENCRSRLPASAAYAISDQSKLPSLNRCKDSDQALIKRIIYRRGGLAPSKNDQEHGSGGTTGAIIPKAEGGCKQVQGEIQRARVMVDVNMVAG